MTDEEVNTNVETVTPDPGEDLWITTNSIINFHGLKPKQFNLDKDDETGLNNMLCDWIRQCQSLIETYVHRTYTPANVAGAVQNVLLRLVSNMVTLAIQRRDSLIIKVNDWTIATVPSDIFTDDLKEDLKPFIKDASNDYGKIGFFAITGQEEDDQDGGSDY